jgi:hypothetical protein
MKTDLFPYPNIAYQFWIVCVQFENAGELFQWLQERRHSTHRRWIGSILLNWYFCYCLNQFRKCSSTEVFSLSSWKPAAKSGTRVFKSVHRDETNNDGRKCMPEQSLASESLNWPGDWGLMDGGTFAIDGQGEGGKLKPRCPQVCGVRLMGVHLEGRLAEHSPTQVTRHWRGFMQVTWSLGSLPGKNIGGWSIRNDWNQLSPAHWWSSVNNRWLWKMEFEVNEGSVASASTAMLVFQRQSTCFGSTGGI